MSRFRMTEMDPNRLQEHILGTYISLRFGIGIITFAFPIAVYLAGHFQGFPLQGSLSAYYWAGMDGHYWARTWFVGGLFAVAAALYLYKGFTRAENIALNLAAVFGLGVAIFPTSRAVDAVGDKFNPHGFSAVSLFVCLAYVVWFRARDTLPLLPPGRDGTNHTQVAKYTHLYRIVSLVMLASPLTAYVLNSFLGEGGSYIFFIESAGVWAFASYWWIKSRELEQSTAERKALAGKIAIEPVGLHKAKAVPAEEPVQ